MALTVEERKEICTLTATKWWLDAFLVGQIVFVMFQVAFIYG
jgi:hypothetical protein